MAILLLRQDKMEFKIVEEKENPLFLRKEIHAEILADVTPSMDETRKALSNHYGVEPSLIRVRSIRSSFGTNVFVVMADIYKSMDEFNRVVKKTKQEIKLEEEKKKAEEEAKKVMEEEAKKESEETKQGVEEIPKIE